MININPEWIAAGAEAVAAVETGVSVLNKKSNEKASVTAQPTAFVLQGGITGQDLLTAALIFAAAMLLLAGAVIVSAAIVHHGLVA